MSRIGIGCCGAYCQTCREFTNGLCRGCRLGYENGERDINRAKCKIKVCCLRERQLETCTDCPNFPSCTIVQGWYEKSQHIRYKKSAEFIREHGYDKFLTIADNWNNAYGKLG